MSITDGIVIRKIGLEELDRLRSLSRITFQETFADGNTVENLKKYIDEAFSTEKLSAELSDAASHFYFAEEDGRALGYLKVNTGGSQTELRHERAVEIERIYVLQELHGKKVGQALFAQAMDLAHDLDADHVWLGVWERNERAIAFYRKNGFEPFSEHVFKLGDDEQTDVMMRTALKPRS